MAEDVSVSDCMEYINIESSGLMSAREVKRAINTVMQIYYELGISKVLVNSQNREDFPTSEESLEVARFLGETTEGKIKFAILIKNDPSNHYLFKSTALSHSGQVSYFNSKQFAIEWLSEI